jgi:hypothetical protein
MSLTEKIKRIIFFRYYWMYDIRRDVDIMKRLLAKSFLLLCETSPLPRDTKDKIMNDVKITYPARTDQQHEEVDL